MMVGSPTEYVLVGVLGYAVPVGAVALLVYWVVRRAVRDGMREAADRLPVAPAQDEAPPPES